MQEGLNSKAKGTFRFFERVQARQRLKSLARPPFQLTLKGEKRWPAAVELVRIDVLPEEREYNMKLE